MLTIPITTEPHQLPAFRVSLGAPLFSVFADVNGALLVVMADQSERLVAADEAEWFIGLCQNCETFEELADYAGWK